MGGIHAKPWLDAPAVILSGAKLWSRREFGECAFPVDGYGSDTQVCALPASGVYCPFHRAIMDDQLKRATL